MKIRPLHDRVMVRRVEEDDRSAGGIIIPDTAKEKPTEGEVIAVGDNISLGTIERGSFVNGGNAVDPNNLFDGDMNTLNTVTTGVVEKTACGGGTNHRVGLYDRVMIKDNHLAALDGDIATAVALAREASPELKIEVEADTVEQARAAAEAGADIVLLDNMSCDQIREAIELIDGRSETEASGGVTLETVREIAGTGVNFISVGALTHSAPSVDIALDFDQIA